ncbi:hypothetical protein [Rhodococcus opacus]|uniref:hypothetical protein n=1 Tax=Rhodococcus opacus TaxID=37919 RepID=UPI002235ECF3|nr:hypothetical protein [Rhodococcus opacus]UZG59690.1 hypothetical protein ONE62_38715 [Rhodococcus opacus]
MNNHPAPELEKLADAYVTANSIGDYEYLTELLEENIDMRHTSGDVDNAGAAPAIQMIKDVTAILPGRGFSECSLIKQVSKSAVVLPHVWVGTPLG